MLMNAAASGKKMRLHFEIMDTHENSHSYYFSKRNTELSLLGTDTRSEVERLDSSRAAIKI
jgi:hypothetical protein